MNRIGIILFTSIIIFLFLFRLLFTQHFLFEDFEIFLYKKIEILRDNRFLNLYPLSYCISEILLDIIVNDNTIIDKKLGEKVCSNLKCDLMLSTFENVKHMNYIFTNDSLMKYTKNHKKINGWMSFIHHNIGI